MRILIIGGSAFMGPHIVRELHAEGHQVFVFNRGQTPAALPDGVEHITGDRQQLEIYAGQLRRIAPDVVLDMILLTGDQARTLMEVFNGAAGRVVAASSGDVYRAYGVMIRAESDPVEETPLKETSPVRTKLYPYRAQEPRSQDDPQAWLDDYEKIQVEQAVMSNTELPGTVLRLPMVHGPGDRQHRIFEYLKRMDDGRPAILLEEGLARWQVTRGYVENTAWAIRLAVTDERAAGRIYNVGDLDALCTSEWVDLIAECAGWEGKIHTLLQDDLRDDLADHLHPGFNTAQDLVYDTNRIRTELGYSERVSLRDGVRRTIAWEREYPPEKVSLNAFNYDAEDRILERLHSG
jgi:nucleoside-diphosphate-sugar epimerase